jgi:type II secretory pathway component PulC
MTSRRFLSKELLYTVAPLAIAAGFAYAAHGGLLCNGGHKTEVRVIAKAAKGTDVEVYQDGKQVKAKRRSAKKRRSGRANHLGSKVYRATETHWVPRNVLDRVVADPSLLSAYGDVVPQRECSTMVGFRIENTVRGGLIRRLGFRDGDLVTAIDDQRLESRRAAREAISGVEDADQVTVTVVRDDKTLQKTFLIE